MDDSRKCGLLPALLFWLSLALAANGWISSAAAEVFELKNGGKIYGKLLNADEKSPTEYVIETEEGMTVRLPVASVKVIPLRELEEKYINFVSNKEDDKKLHETMVKSCMDNNLLALAKAHRERILDLDPNNKQQREVLNYLFTERDGWIYEDKYYARMGMVKYKSNWKFPEEVAKIEAADAAKTATIKAGKELSRFIQDALQEGRRSAQAMQYLRDLKDPATIPKIQDLLLKGKEPVPSLPVKRLLVEALIRFQTPEALSILCELSLVEKGEIADRAREEAVKLSKPFVVSYYLSALLRSGPDGPDLEMVNRAGEGLGELGDRQAIKPLIKVLVAKKTRTVSPGGQTNVSANGGMSMGGKPVVEEKIIPNPGVLSGLQSLTGASVREPYNQAAWEQWYAETHSRSHLSLQRDP